MCTVSFIPVRDSFFITTNRDEKNSRKKAIPPVAYFINNQKLFFPKDADAGGTWIAMKENGDAAVLLNGAFICHRPEPAYRQSRGIVLLEIFSTPGSCLSFNKINLENIEPFTLILFENKSLYEFRWDGHEKYSKQLPLLPHTWFSATLYDGIAVKKKEELFISFIATNPLPSRDDIMQFYQDANGSGNLNEQLMINGEIYSTQSITIISILKDCCSMHYTDIKNNCSSELTTDMHQTLFTIE